MPSFVQQEIFPLSSEQERAVVEVGVIRLTCGDYQFPDKVCIYLLVTMSCHLVHLVLTYRRLQPAGCNPASGQSSSGPGPGFNPQ